MEIVKQQNFITTRLEVCRHCHGTGKVGSDTCPTCGGLRMVRKTIEGTVTVERLPPEY